MTTVLLQGQNPQLQPSSVSLPFLHMTPDEHVFDSSFYESLPVSGRRATTPAVEFSNTIVIPAALSFNDGKAYAGGFRRWLA